MDVDFRTWLLAADQCHFSTTKIETSGAYEDFQSWFSANGGFLHPSVEIASADDGGNFVRVKQDHVIVSGTVVVSCPHRLTISWPIVNHHHFPHVHSTFTAHVATRLFLMKQRLLKAQSPWWPYIKSLPLSFSTPLWYDEIDLIWLRGTNLGNAKETREKTWRQEYEKTMQSLFSSGVDSKERHLWTWELYLWAATVMTTRAFAGPASPSPNQGDPKTATGDVEKCQVLIPGLDLLNHNPSADVSWIWDEGACALRTNDSTASGCQVWNNYDPKSNEELIMGYGFSLPENVSDHYSLGFSPAIAAYTKAAEARRAVGKQSSEVLQSQNIVGVDTQVLESSEDLSVKERLEQNIHWVRLIDNKKYEFSPHFLEYFSIAVENPREARRATGFSSSQTYFFHEDVSRNRLHVVCALLMILQKGQRAIRKHDTDLPEAPQNSKQVDAARYRGSQLKILDCVLDYIGSFLKSVDTKNASEHIDPRVIRLEHIFTNLPKPLLKDLRGVLNAGVGTRDPIKIRERGGLDFAFTAWLCGLWAYAQPDSEGEDEIDPTYLRWLLFLRRSYPEPSDESTSHQKSEGDGLERAERLDPIRGGSGNSELDFALIARSYFDAVQAAIEKRSQSVYNDQRITVRRLEWCLNVIRNEGVRWPSLDEEENDQADDWVIVLEFEDSCDGQSLG